MKAPFISYLTFLGTCSLFDLQAQSITTDVTRISSDAFYFSADNITYTSGGTGSMFGGSAEMLCIEIGEDEPLNTQVAYNVVSAGSLFDESGGGVRGEDYIHWIFDNHFDRLFDTSSPDYEFGYSRYNFQEALYELTFDYNGTLASLNPNSGQISGTPPGKSEYINILNDIVASDSSISTGYRSTLYDIAFLQNVGDVVGGAPSQDMVLFNLKPVPEPSAAMLVGLAGLMALFRRSRKV